jgi:hypothetical protein
MKKSAIATRRIFTWIVVLASLLSLWVAPGGRTGATAATGAAPTPYGMDLLRHPEQISRLRPLVRSLQVSSHDRSGANTDGYPPPGGENYAYLTSSSPPNYVLLDESGPGTITRLWFAYSDAEWDQVYHWYKDRTLLFFFDGEKMPRLSMTLNDLFAGTHPPFLSPLVGNPFDSSGGHYSYIPMAFRSKVRVEMMGGPPGYYNIGYEKNDESLPAVTFDPVADVSDVVALWQNAGQDPKHNSDSIQTVSGTVGADTAITPGAARTLADVTGPAVIQSIKLTVAGNDDPSDPAAREFFTKVRVRATWDGSGTANVDAPLGALFGSFAGKAATKGLFFGYDAVSNTFYNYFPMPFGSRGTIEIVNGTAAPISGIGYTITYTQPVAIAGLGSDVGYFNARYNAEEPVTPGRDFNMATLQGNGHVVATSMLIHCFSLGSYGYNGCLEGDERVYIDGSLSPDVYGTGTEDFFNGGFYFQNGTFSRPTHGNNYTREVADSSGAEGFREDAAWRALVADPFEFRSGIRIGIEHGSPFSVTTASNWWPGKYYSVVSWYGTATSGMVQTDLLDVGDSTSMTGHQYNSTGTGTGSQNFYYEGDDDDVVVADTGEGATAPVQFQMAVDGSRTAILRRRMDQAVRPQRVVVTIDDNNLGEWYDSSGNTALRWRDSELMIPRAYVNGKTSVTVRITPVTGSTWTAYRYEMFSVAGSAVSVIAADPDLDAVLDPSDNCPTVANPDQANSRPNFIDLHVYGKLFDDTTALNSTTLGDVCNPDLDGDALSNDIEAQLGPSGAAHGQCPGATANTDPLKLDTDGDGFTDRAECMLGTDPVDPASHPPASYTTGDTDHDGLPDALEATLGTNPMNPDSDGDRLLDGVEFLRYGSDPLNPKTDGDICSDGREAASFNDDTKVNSADLLVVAKANSRKGEAKYVPDFDVNKDDKINSADLLLVAKLQATC